MAKNGMSLDDVVVHLLHRVSPRADDMFANEVEVTGLNVAPDSLLWRPISPGCRDLGQ
jgi:hypothetical protein